MNLIEDIAAQELVRWNELDPNIRARAIARCRELPLRLLIEVKEAIDEFGVEWMQKIHGDTPYYSFHFYDGMGVRNFLRATIKDKELPTGNWDDYYVPALECAALLEV